MAKSQDRVGSACVAEAVGTLLLCFVGGGAICTNALLGREGFGLLGIAVAHGLALSIAVTASMGVSGGHINPAVTIAMLVTGRIAPDRAAKYIASQIIGGAIGGALLTLVFQGLTTPAPESLSVVMKTGLGTPQFDPSIVTPWHAAMVEAILTFVLVFAIFGTAVDPRHPNVGGFGIGLAIAMDILVGGPITGAAMNPARVLGTGLFSGIHDFWGAHWVYWVGPCGGAIAAAMIYHFLVLEPVRVQPAQTAGVGRPIS